MLSASKIKKLIFDNNISFEKKTKVVFSYQHQQLSVFRKFCDHLFSDFETNNDLSSYPFLPIEFFRSHAIISEGLKAAKTFESSGTTNVNNSKHLVSDLKLYEESILKSFQQFYGQPSEYVIFGVLPSYLERSNASLVHMVKYLMDQSKNEESGFYKFNYKELLNDITNYNGNAKKIIIGVTFALWEMAEQFQHLNLSDCIIMETGGMKGRKREILREELHAILCKSFNVSSIHSEYGMTEMLSQAYSTGKGIYKCPPWMKVLVRDPYDPKNLKSKGKGVINIIDLANLHSCSFLATNDIGEVFEDGSFKVLGRMDNSRLRGCNLMFQ